MAFFAFSSGWEALIRLAGKRKPGYCIILYYHCVTPEGRRKFAKQMDMLLRNAIPVSVDRTEPLETGKHYAAVTFDDGFNNVGEQAVPELIERRIPATIFVMSDLLGQTPGWKGYPGKFMSLDELRCLPDDLIRLGSHTRTHPFLPRLAEKDAVDEICSSRVRLEQMLGRKCNLFAFPYGAFNDHHISICRDAGYERIFTTLPYLSELGPCEFVAGRVTVEPTDYPMEFYLKLHGAYRWLPMAFGFKRKLKSLFVSSSVVNNPMRTLPG